MFQVDIGLSALNKFKRCIILSENPDLWVKETTKILEILIENPEKSREYIDENLTSELDQVLGDIGEYDYIFKRKYIFMHSIPRDINLFEDRYNYINDLITKFSTIEN